MLSKINKDKTAEADANMDKWINHQVRKRVPLRYMGMLVVLGLLVYYACEYVWR